MADQPELDFIDQNYAAGPTPAGLSQVAQQPMKDGQLSFVEDAQSWYGGANMDGTQNGYNTTFMDELFKQQNEAAQSGTMEKVFERPDATGIVSWDYTGLDSKGDRRNFRFGDVFAKGEYVGNVYDVYDPATADTLMADMTLDANSKQELFQQGGTALSDRMQEVRTENTRNWQDMRSAQGFNADVQERAKGYEEGAKDDAAIFGAGAAGGAAIAAPSFALGPEVGIPVTAAASLIGGLSAWLNKDEIVQGAARAKAMQDLAGEQFNAGAGISTGLQQWSTLAQKFITPLSNTVHGAYDVSQGEWGDAQSEFYEIDSEGNARPGWVTTLDIGAGFGDAALQFLSPWSRGIYMASMSGNIAGSVGQLVTSGGYTFDDRSGDFDSIVRDQDGNFDPGALAAGIGNIGIDAVQLGMARGLVGKARNSVREVSGKLGSEANRSAKFGAEAIGVPTRAETRSFMEVITGKPAAASYEEKAGWRYALDEAGNVMHRTPTISLLAPSEAIGSITVGARARRAALDSVSKQPGKMVLKADDYYRAANTLQFGERNWTNALVNGFGEGTEELFQAVFEPLSHDRDIDPQAVAEAWFRGAAMGAGMSWSMGRQGASADERMFSQAFTVHAALNGETLTRESWNKMTDTQKRNMAAAPKVFGEQLKAVAKWHQDQQNTTMVTSVAGLEKRAKAIQQRFDAETGKMTSATDRSFRITSHSDASAMPNYAVGSTLLTLIGNVKDHLRGLNVQQEYTGGVDPEQAQATAAAVIAEGEKLLAYLETRHTEARELRKSQGDLAGLVDEVNAVIREWFDMSDTGPIVQLSNEGVGSEQREARSRAVSLVFTRYPQDQGGSFQIFMPQIDRGLEFLRGHNTLQLSQSVTQPMGADYDGDKIRLQAQLILDDNAWRSARAGDTFMTTNSKKKTKMRIGTATSEESSNGMAANIEIMGWERWEIDALAEGLRSSRQFADQARGTLNRITDSLQARYSGEVDPSTLNEVLMTFRQNITEGDPLARQNLIESLAENLGNDIVRYARTHASNEWLFVDQLMHENLQQFQREYASHREVPGDTNISVISNAPRKDEYSKVRRAWAATWGSTLGNLTGNDVMLRMFQALHYSSISSPDLSATPEGNVAELADLTLFYESLSQGISQTELERLGGDNEISTRVLAQLYRVAVKYAPELKLSPGRSLAIIAGMSMPEIRVVNGVQQFVPGKALVQSLLEQEIARDKQANPRPLPEQEMQWAALTEFLSKDQVEEAVAEVLGTVSLYELMGESSLAIGANLTLRQAIAKIGNQSDTQRDASRDRLRLDPDYKGMQDSDYYKKSGKSDMPYTEMQVRGSGVNPTTATTDVLLAVTNKRLTLIKEGDSKWLAGGWLGDGVAPSGGGRPGKRPMGRSGKKTAEAAETFRNIRESLERLSELYSFNPKSADSIAQAMDSWPELAGAVLELLPNDIATVAMRYDPKSQEVHTAPWVYTMLTLDPDHAVAYYWTQLHLAKWQALGLEISERSDGSLHGRTFDGLDDRIMQMFYRMAHADDNGVAWKKLMDVMKGATDIHAILKHINQHLRVDEAPYTAWFNDVSEFSPDRNSTLTSVQSGARLREGMSTAAARARSLVDRVAREEQIELGDAQVMQTLKDAIEATVEGRPMNSSQKQVYKQAQNMLKFAKARATTLGPGAMQFFLVGALSNFMGHMHTKGVSADHAVRVGAAEGVDAPGYLTSFAQYRNGLTAHDADSLGANMSLLTTNVRSMDESGRPIEWEALTVETMVTAWADVTARGAIRSILFPSVMDMTESGVTQQFLVGPSVKELLEKDIYRELFEDNHASRMKYAAYLDSIARQKGGNAEVLRAAKDLELARSTALKQALTPSEYEHMATEALTDIVAAARALGSFGDRSVVDSETNETVHITEWLRRRLKAEARTRSVQRNIGLDIDTAGGTEAQTLDTLIATYTSSQSEALRTAGEREQAASQNILTLEQSGAKPAALRVARQEHADAQARLQSLAAELESRVEMLKNMFEGNAVETVKAVWVIPWGSESQLARQERLVEYVRSHPQLAAASRGEQNENIAHLTRVMRNKTRRDEDGLPILAYGDEASRKIWNSIASAVIMHQFDLMAGGVHAEDMALLGTSGEFKAHELKYVDDSYMYLVDALLDKDGPLYKAMTSFHVESGTARTTTTTKELLQVMRTRVMNHDKFGRWTEDVARQSAATDITLTSAASPFGISRSGMSPQRQQYESVSTVRTYEVPPAGTELSQVELTGAQILGLEGATVPVAKVPGPQGLQDVEMSVQQLNNRFVGSVTGTFVDPTTNLETPIEELLNRSRPQLGKVYAVGGVPHQGGSLNLQTITVRQLAVALDSVLPEGTDGSKVRVVVSFLHPNQQPDDPAFMNNVYYEGTSFELDSDHMISLDSTLWFSPGGVSPMAQAAALKSVKGGGVLPLAGAALVNPNDPTRGYRTLEIDFLTNLAGVIRQKTDVLIAEEIDGGYLHETMYNAVYKSLKMKHFVRGINPISGEAELWHAEKVIAWQLANPGQPLPLDSAELWIPSDKVLRTMMGDKGPQSSAATAQTGGIIDLSKVDPWLGVTPAVLARVPRALDFDTAAKKFTTGNLFNTVASARTWGSQLTVRPAFTDETRSAFQRNLDTLGARRQEIFNERAVYKMTGDKTFIGRNQALTKKTLKAMTNSAQYLDIIESGLPFLPTRSLMQGVLSKKVFKELSDAVTMQEGQAVWELKNASGVKDVLSQGVITPAVVNGQVQVPAALRVALRDPIIVNLSSFESDGQTTAEAMKTLQPMLQWAIDRGAVLVLSDEKTGGDLRAEARAFIKSQPGYEGVAGSWNVFQMRDSQSYSKTEWARASTLLDTGGVNIDNLLINFALINSPYGNNAAAVVKSEVPNNVVATIDLLPTNFLGSFNVPRRYEDVQVTKQQVRALVDPQNPKGMSHLRVLIEQGVPEKIQGIERAEKVEKEFKSLTAALKELIDSWDSDETNPSVLPRAGSAFGPGSIIPLFDARTNEMILYRHGYEAPNKTARRRQLNTPYDEEGGAANLAIFTDKVNATHTTHRGTWVGLQPHSQFGLSVRLNVDLALYGDTLRVEGTGMKYVLTSLSQKLRLPRARIFGNTGIGIISGYSDLQAKESTLGLVNNFRSGWAMFGADHMPRLVRFFTGEDISQPLPETLTEEELNAAVAHRQALVQQVEDFLREYSTSIAKRSPGAIQEMMRATNIETVASEAISQLTEFTTQSFGAREWAAELSGTAMSTDAYVARTTLLYLMADTARFDHIRESNGLGVQGAHENSLQTNEMPRLFTDAFTTLPLDSTIRQELFDDLNARIHVDAKTKKRDYYIAPDWTVYARDSKGKEIAGYLQYMQVVSSGDNPVLDAQAWSRSGSSQNVSPTTTTVAYAGAGAQQATRDLLEHTEAFATGTHLPDLNVDGALWAMLRDIPKKDNSFTPWRTQNLAERHRARMGRDAVASYRQTLTGRKQWEQDPESGRDWTDIVDEKAGTLIGTLQMSGKHRAMVDFWIRQFLGQPAGAANGVEITGRNAADAIDAMLTNVRNGLLPLHGGFVSQMHAYDLAFMYKAGGLKLLDKPNGEVVTSWTDWVDVALGMVEVEANSFDPVYTLAVDGFMHTFVDAMGNAIGLPPSRSALVNRGLLDPETNQLLAVSLDPNARAIMAENPILEGAQADLAVLLGGAYDENGSYVPQAVQPAVVERQRGRLKKWRAKSGTPDYVAQSKKSYRERGIILKTEGTQQNALLRIMVDLRVAGALLNPLLFISAGPETMIRGMLEDVTNILRGESTGLVGSKFNVRYTPEQLKKLNLLYRNMGGRQVFKGMIYDELGFKHPKIENAGKIEVGVSKLAHIGGRWQDPTYGMRADALARRYVESVLLYVAQTPTENTPSVDYIVAQLTTNPAWAKKNMPKAHSAAMGTIANIRSLKQTPASMFLKGIYEPLSNNPSFLVSAPSTLFLKLPLIFSTYAANVATTILGLQGPMTALAMFTEGRNKGFIGRIQAAMAGRGTEFDPDNNTFNMDEALEGVDLAKSFIQSGVTVSNLFALGMMAGGLGLSGEDEEDRRRRRAAELSGVGYLYDPRKIENDFRNADAVFLDWLPFGFSSFFEVPSINGERSMGQLHWLVRQFVSPVIGIEKFFETGDTRQIMWGFEDALGAFPLINYRSMQDAQETFAMLDTHAKNAEADGSPEAMTDAYGWLLNGVAQYERMLFENSFVNSIYTSLDKYDRDPWVLPEVDAEGNVMRDRLSTPRSTKAMDSYIDADGNVQQGYHGRDWLDAQVHQLAENRAGFALFMSLFTGLSDSDYLRQNMVVKQREMPKPELDQQELEGLVLSLMDSEGFEYLTDDGARAVFRGLNMGSIELGSPALEGVYATKETRLKIQYEWLDELNQEGVDMGLTEYEAKQRANSLWYGHTQEHPELMGIRDFLWDESVSYSPTFKYKQLNTTYVMGPDGRPWATGATRDVLYQAFGLPPVGRYYAGEVGNMGVDTRLNSVDAAGGINTGLRALEKVDDSWNVPTPEEIGQGIEDAIRDLDNKSYSPSKSGGFGGGGSGARWNRLNTPMGGVTPYAHNLQSLNSYNPNVRRADIRRERFSSDRGRLKPWQ